MRRIQLAHTHSWLKLLLTKIQFNGMHFHNDGFALNGKPIPVHKYKMWKWFIYDSKSGSCFRKLLNFVKDVLICLINQSSSMKLLFSHITDQIPYISNPRTVHSVHALAKVVFGFCIGRNNCFYSLKFRTKTSVAIPIHLLTMHASANGVCLSFV